MEKAEYAEFNVPTCDLQFVSCAEKDKALSGQHPFFPPSFFLQVYLLKLSHRNKQR